MPAQGGIDPETVIGEGRVSKRSEMGGKRDIYELVGIWYPNEHMADLLCVSIYKQHDFPTISTMQQSTKRAGLLYSRV